ncbi:hypothetical protein [uncultured Alsobacter sp.]|uniref:hypothetical protein n=1 Tax=uncultured Alsobacter sp. TaxID=1748258 RepID=UPI0025D2E8E0|nr:hypothetical protein [uncultured Alsobacter sp.]
MSLNKFRDGGAFCRSVYAGGGSATAGGAGDNTAANGPWVNRDQGVGGMFRSAKLVISYTAALGAAATLTFNAKMQDATSSGGAGAADIAADTIDNFAIPATIVGTGAGTVTGTIELDLNLAKAKQYLRTVITPDLSAANTDTCTWQATLIMFGFDRDPVTKTLA